jgi:hypothetical protein
MNCLNWEQLQNIANNMLANTDQPEELIKLYLKKMYSLLLDAPVEIHPYMIQALRDTGITDDTEFMNLFQQCSLSEVTEMEMIESHGGYKSRKLNKGKKQSGGANKKSKKVTVHGDGDDAAAADDDDDSDDSDGDDHGHGDDGDDHGDGDDNLSESEPKSTSLVNSESLTLQALQKSTVEQFGNVMQVDDAVVAQIRSNPAFGVILNEMKQESEQGMKALIKLEDDYKNELKELEEKKKNRKAEIQAKFDSDINKIWWQIGGDALMWVGGSYLWYLLMNSPVATFFSITEAGIGTFLLGPELMFIINFVVIGGLLGGLLKVIVQGNLSLDKYNPSDQPSKRGWCWWAAKGLAGLALDRHPGTHAIKLYQEKEVMPTGLDIFRLHEWVTYEENIDAKKEAARIRYEKAREKLMLWIEEIKRNRLDRIQDPVVSHNILMVVRKNELTILDQNSHNLSVSTKPTVEEVFEEPSLRQRKNKPRITDGNVAGKKLLAIQNGKKKTKGGMKKVSKKNLKKTRKSRY